MDMKSNYKIIFKTNGNAGGLDTGDDDGDDNVVRNNKASMMGTMKTPS